MEAVAFTGGVLLVAVHCREHGHDPWLCWARLAEGLAISILAWQALFFFIFNFLLTSFTNRM